MSKQAIRWWCNCVPPAGHRHLCNSVQLIEAPKSWQFCTWIIYYANKKLAHQPNLPRASGQWWQFSKLASCCFVRIALERCYVRFQPMKQLNGASPFIFPHFILSSCIDLYVTSTYEMPYQTISWTDTMHIAWPLLQNPNGISLMREFSFNFLLSTYLLQGNQAFKDKQWQKAIGFYTEAIKLYGSNATYFSNRAAAYLELGRY